MEFYSAHNAFLLGQGAELEDDFGQPDTNVTSSLPPLEQETEVQIIDNRIDPLTAVHNYG